MSRDICYLKLGHSEDFYRHSIEDPNSFWGEQAKLIDWHKPFSRVLDYSKPPFARWFVDGQTNLCHNAVDRHLEKYSDQKALIYGEAEVSAAIACHSACGEKTCF